MISLVICSAVRLDLNMMDLSSLYSFCSCSFHTTAEKATLYIRSPLRYFAALALVKLALCRPMMALMASLSCRSILTVLLLFFKSSSKSSLDICLLKYFGSNRNTVRRCLRASCFGGSTNPSRCSGTIPWMNPMNSGFVWMVEFTNPRLRR